MQGIDMLGISERQLAGEVLVSGQKGRKSICTVVGRQQNIYYSLCKGLDVADKAGTALVQNKHYRLTCSGKSLYQFLLVGRKVKVVHIARSLTIRILSDTSDNHICATSGSNCAGDAGSILCLPVSTGFVNYAWFITNILKTGLHGLQNSIVLRSEVIGITLPGIAPTAIQSTHRVGIGTGNEYALRTLERQYTLILEQNLGLYGSCIRLLCKTLRGKLLVIIIPYRVVK